MKKVLALAALLGALSLGAHGQEKTFFWNFGSVEFGIDMASTLRSGDFGDMSNYVATFSLINFGYLGENEDVLISSAIIKGIDNGDNDLAFILPLDLGYNLVKNEPWYLGPYVKYHFGYSTMDRIQHYFEGGIRAYMKTRARPHTLYYSMVNELVLGVNSRFEVFLSLKLDIGAIMLLAAFMKTESVSDSDDDEYFSSF